MEGSWKAGRPRWSALALAGLLALTGCGGGGDEEEASQSQAIELASRLPSDDALNVAIADVTAIRKTLGMPPGSIPPTNSDDHDLSFLEEVSPALGILNSGEFPQPVIDEALQRAGWVAGVAGDRGVTAFTVSGDTAGFEPLLRDAGLTDEDGEWVDDGGDIAIALGDGLIAFADDPGDAKPVVEDDPGDAPEELEQLDGEGELITLARFGADCVDAIATIDTPGEDGEVAFFTTATPDTSKITGDGIATTRARVEGDSARISIPAAREPIDEPPALTALQELKVDYDCDA